MTTGNYFKDKEEAIEFYRNNEENLKDKPDWLIECMIDFAIQHPNYKEYLEVEERVKVGKPLTAKQKKKYGHLKWDKEYNEFEDGDVITDAVTCQEAGTFDDLTDPVVREKYNKYGLNFGQHLPPEPEVHLVKPNEKGELEEIRADIKEVSAILKGESDKKLDDVVKITKASEDKKMLNKSHKNA